MGKQIFFDIDGTLIDCMNDQYHISNETIKALNKLKENGHEVYLATGRCHCFILDSVLEYPFSGYVTCNGGHVTHNGEVVYKNIIPKEALNEVIKLCDEFDINYYFEGNDNIYVKDKEDALHLEFIDRWGMKQETCIDNYNIDEIESYIGMIVMKNLEDEKHVFDRLSKYFYIQRHQSPYSFDLTLKDTSKANGIKQLMKKLNKSMDDTIAFGDGLNDLEMIKEVHIGIAMGNGVNELKEISDYVTDSVINEGIVKALKHLNLI